MIKKYSFSKIALFVIFIIVLITNFQLKKWNDPNGVINADVRAYYAYLPALFIHQDLKFEHSEIYNNDQSTFVWTFDTGNNSRYIKLTSGMAMIYSPFFLVAHQVARKIDVEANGFTSPYKIALIASSLFFLLIALIFARKTLLIFFNERVTTFVLLILFLGTNLFHYYTGDPAMSHGYSIALIFLFIYSVIKWIEKPSLKWSFWIGITAGFFTLIRPTDIIYILFFLLYNITSLEDIKNRFILFWKQKWLIVFILIMAFIVFIPQFIYFKYIFNEWLHFTYSGETFFFLNPQLINLSFSYRNGWLVYSPLMLLSIVGFFYLKNVQPKISWFVIIVFIIYYYTLSSWWCWWYSGFGNRAMINLYPLLIFPLGALLSSILEKKRWMTVLCSLFVSIGILFSMFQAYQYRNWMIHYDSMSKDAYWDSFGRMEASQLFKLYLEEPILEASLNGAYNEYVQKVDTVYSKLNSFELKESIPKEYAVFISSKDHFNGEKSLFVENIEYALGQKVSVKKINHIYISAWIKNNQGVHVSLQSDNGFYALNKSVKETKNGWSKVDLLAEIPSNIQSDSISFYIWNNERQDYYLDNLEIIGLNISKEEKHD